MDSTVPTQREMKAFLLHLVVYGTLLLLYFILVLRYWAPWLLSLFHHHRVEYALAAILLMVGQAVGLEIVSHFLLRLIRRKKA
jgi:predicted tellurium resistance membrane protein TerC